MAVKLTQIHHRNLSSSSGTGTGTDLEASSMIPTPSDSDLGQAAHDRSHEEHLQHTESRPSPVIASKPSFFHFTRHTLGVLLTLLVVTLWVSANFLTWVLFSHETYSKPYLVSYVNSAMFTVYLIPWLRRGGISELKSRWSDGERPWSSWDLHNEVGYTRIGGDGDDGDNIDNVKQGKLGLFATIRLSIEFAILWWLANYFSSVCYVYTSAASGSILSSTSSAWTLMLCALFRVERFTWSKALAVVVSLIGVAIISNGDLSELNRDPQQDIPTRTSAEILLGDFLALIGAVFYGVYTTLLKVRVGDESRVDMQLLFGLSGLINTLVLWPGVVIAHICGWEPFELPSSSQIWFMLAANFAMNLIADVSWAYAMLLTTPLLVTVGLSLTIPIALLAQMLLFWKVPGILYWTGAALVFGAFFLVHRESEPEAS